MLYFGFQKLEIYQLSKELAFELGYLKKDVFENISKKAKKLSVKMSYYIASIKKTTFKPYLQLYLNSIFCLVKIFNH